MNQPNQELAMPGKKSNTEYILGGFGMFIAVMVVVHVCLRYRHKKNLTAFRDSLELSIVEKKSQSLGINNINKFVI